MQPLVQLLLTVVMYSIMGLTVGVGIVLARKYPQIGELLKERPVIGWTLAFTAGSVVVTVVIAIMEYAALLLLSRLQ